MPAIESSANEFTPQDLSRVLRSSSWIGTHWYVSEWVADCKPADQDDSDAESPSEALQEDACNKFKTLRDSIHSEQRGMELALPEICSLLDNVWQFENIVVTGSVAPLVVRFPYRGLLYDSGDVTIEFRDSDLVFVFSRHPEILSGFKSMSRFKDLRDEDFLKLGPW